MPTNRDLREQITAIAKDLGVEVETNDLNNAELAEMLGSLKSQEDALLNTLSGASAPSGPSVPLDLPALSLCVHVVAPGRAIKCLAGVRNGGDAITARHVGGESELAQMVASGAVLRRNVKRPS